MKNTITLLGGLTVLILQSCGLREVGGKDTIKADYTIKVDQTINIKLQSNPSTGYSWQWANKKMVAIVDTTKMDYQASNTGLVGSGGEEVWTFKGIKPGIDSVLLT